MDEIKKKELIEIIKYNLDDGFSEEIITEELLKKGNWTSEEIKEGFNIIQNKIGGNLNNQEKKVNAIYDWKKKRNINLFFIIIHIIYLPLAILLQVRSLLLFLALESKLALILILPQYLTLFIIFQFLISLITLSLTKLKNIFSILLFFCDIILIIIPIRELLAIKTTEYSVLIAMFALFLSLGITSIHYFFILKERK